MNWAPFITCAVTGAGDSAGKHPGLPVTPEQIANAALEAAAAGAAIVHIHVRDPETTRGSRELNLYREVVQHIRESEIDVLINLTTGMGGDLIVGPGGAEDTPASGSDFVGAYERLEHVVELRPDICTLDCGSMNFDDESLLYVMPPSYLRASAERIKELGVKPELEVFDLGQLVFVKRMIAEGLIAAPPMIQICLGIPYGAPATARAMLAMAADLPPRPSGAASRSGGWRCRWWPRRCCSAAISASASRTISSSTAVCWPPTPISSPAPERSWNGSALASPTLTRRASAWD